MTNDNTVWKFGEISIRRWESQRMVNITDIWKSAGSPSSMRPDKWFKSPLIQETLESFAILLDQGLERDQNAKLIKVPGVLEVVKGGRYSQGTFVSYELAINYTELLGTKIHDWFTNVLFNTVESETKTDNSNHKLLPVHIDDFNGQVRFTPDGRISVYDAIGFSTGNKNPHEVWKRLQESHSEVLTRCENFQFPGQGQRLTPVATLQLFLEILVLLPGKLAASIREEAVRTLVRVMNGDLTLVDEIVARIKNPQDLRILEESIRTRCIKAYGSGSPSGTIINPLTEITSEIKKGYGWSKKLAEMQNLLVELATYIGDMVVDRKLPHRSYDSATKAKSRIIPLTIRALEDLNTLHIYLFQDNYVDDADVVDLFSEKAYPEVAYRDYAKKGVTAVVAHLVSPAGITVAGCQRLNEIQKTLNDKYQNAIFLDAMKLDELVWGVMYPAIEERYRDASGKFASHQLNRKIRKICTTLCEKTNNIKSLNPGNNEHKQLSLFGELLSSAK